MSAAQPTKADGNVHGPRLADLFGSDEDADCVVAFVREGDSKGKPLLELPAHKVIVKRMADFFKAQVGNKHAASARLAATVMRQGMSPHRKQPVAAVLHSIHPERRRAAPPLCRTPDRMV